MFRNLLLTIGFILVSNLVVFSQSGTLKGKIFDKATKEPIPFANIVIELGGAQKGGGTSDFDGNYMIKPIPPGTYDLKATYVGYNTVLVRGMVINADQIRFYDIEMESTAEQLPEIIVSDFAIPLINKDETVSGGQITEEEIKKMPNRSVEGVATTVGGVFSEDGERGNVRGARSDQTIMFIDGIRVLGSTALPQSSIEQVAVYLGGLPAQYGDARGGIINVTTKGPSGKFGAGLELEQSLDAYGHSRVGLNLQGPIIKSKKESATSILGYFFSGDGYYNKDQRPTARGVYVATDETQKHIEEYPLVPSGLSSGTFSSGEFVRKDNLELLKTNPNASRYGVNLSGKLDLRATTTANFTFGGQYNLDDGKVYSFANTMFNSDKNYLYKNESWRVFGRFTQRFISGAESNSLVKNVYYSLQFDYSQQNTRSMDPDHKDDIFKYGYLGKYTTYKTKTVELVPTLEINDVIYENVFALNSWDFDTAYVFEAANYNPLIARYTEQIYDLFPTNWETGATEGNWSNSDQLELRGGLLNGDGPAAFYGIWSAPGALQTGYGESHDNQISINATASADIGNHEVKFGFIYDQRIERGFSYSAGGIWSRMRGLTNFHIRELDIDNPQTEYLASDNFVYYYRKYDEISQFTFDKNLRNKLGLDEKGLDFILVDSYSFDDNTIQYYDKDGFLHTRQLDGDLYSIDMFSADELLNDGRYIAYAYGYDYYGNKLTSKPSIEDFFTQLDANGDHTRPIPAYEPIYMAGYIQDKFAFKDLIFNIGVRVDRFDANQPVLKDPFLMYPAKTVQETTNIGGNYVNHPGNMGSDYVVYVDNINAPTEITGYRNEFTWYNAEGVEIQDPYILDRGSGISPMLVDPGQISVNSKAFEDYEPQINVMPRISFSFPISDEALFFAHYDVLTQRPLETSGLIPLPITI
ncbi:MAG: hypothetical protein FJY07_00730 [Bacteroidetes bacterium]|nr:hypothetical protein [Bacteroidota bacterium]